MMHRVINSWLSIVAIVFSLCAAGNLAKAEADEYPLSLQLQVLERDLTSQDYHDVLKTMISTDLAAEWQRVATPDNYHLFAKQHGGMEKVKADQSLHAVYTKREQIAAKFLDLIRGVYEQKKVKVPFDDEAVLIRVLESAAKGASKAARAEVPVRFVAPCEGAEKQWPCFRGPT